MQWLNDPQPKEEIENIRYAIKRRPHGSEPWVSKAVARFGLENTLRNPWRPEKGMTPFSLTVLPFLSDCWGHRCPNTLYGGLECDRRTPAGTRT